MAYPNKFLRGIPDKSYLHEGNPLSHLFQFDEPKEKRLDNYKECSINWYDCEQSLKLLLGLERKPGELKYKEGITVLSRTKYDTLKKRPLFRDILNYERQTVDGNKYHGNLLIPNTTPAVLKLILSSIAVQCFLEIVPPDTETMKHKSLLKKIKLIWKNFKTNFLF